MKKDEARPLIIGAFRSWVKDNGVKSPTGTDALAFFGDLTANRSDLLNFRQRGDKWQVVHGWLLSANLVND